MFPVQESQYQYNGFGSPERLGLPQEAEKVVRVSRQLSPDDADQRRQLESAVKSLEDLGWDLTQIATVANELSRPNKHPQSSD